MSQGFAFIFFSSERAATAGTALTLTLMATAGAALTLTLMATAGAALTLTLMATAGAALTLMATAGAARVNWREDSETERERGRLQQIATREKVSGRARQRHSKFQSVGCLLI